MTKALFYRAVARIRAIDLKDGVVPCSRLQKVFKLGPIEAVRLKDSLVNAGVLRDWTETNFKGTKGKRGKTGNILWENMHKVRVPREIMEKEAARVATEKLKGLE